MSQFTPGPVVTFLAGEALTRYQRVYIDTSVTTDNQRATVKVAGVLEDWIGVAFEAAASGYAAPILMKDQYGTVPMVASTAITRGALVYPAASGYISDTGLYPFGRCIDTVSAATYVTEVVMGVNPLSLVGDLHGFEDNFITYTTGDTWTTTTENSGTCAVTGDAVGGSVTLTTGGTDNNGLTMATTDETFLFAADKPIHFKAVMLLTEAATSVANLFVGLASGGNSVDVMQDTGAGPQASYSGLGFFKAETLIWQAESSLAGTQDTDTNIGAFVSAQEYELECYWLPVSATSGVAYFYRDGSLVHTSTFTYTSATEMNFVCHAKCGTSSAQTMIVKYAYCKQLR